MLQKSSPMRCATAITVTSRKTVRRVDRILESVWASILCQRTITEHFSSRPLGRISTDVPRRCLVQDDDLTLLQQNSCNT
jgi:hypothetical protein